MNFVQSRRMQSRTSRVDVLPRKQKPSKMLSLYLNPPTEEITLDEFEMYSLDRLHLLRSVEVLRSRGLSNEEFLAKLQQQESKYMPLRAYENAAEDSRKDTISHFILRLAYCRSEDLRRWFLSQESTLFRIRLERLSDEERTVFVNSNGLMYEVVPESVKVSMRDHLTCFPGINQLTFNDTRYYKVPFTQALDLISNRSVYLTGGYAYVPIPKLVSIVVARFRTHLSKELMHAANMFSHVIADPRIGPLLKNMNKQYIGNDYSKTEAVDRLTADRISQAAQLHMPLCMRVLHESLIQNHHLKHGGRLQYGLFLKGAGMRLEDAMIFWQTEFTKNMTLEEFTKKYAYNIRHNYGQEGKRVDYTPKSCSKIIMGTPPGVGEYHGCPYKHYDEAHLSALLSKVGIAPSISGAILAKSRAGHYGVACQLHFEAFHPNYSSMPEVKSEGVGNHPNGWFLASVQYHKAKSGATGHSSSNDEDQDNLELHDDSVPMEQLPGEEAV